MGKENIRLQSNLSKLQEIRTELQEWGIWNEKLSKELKIEELKIIKEIDKLIN